MGIEQDFLNAFLKFIVLVLLVLLAIGSYMAPSLIFQQASNATIDPPSIQESSLPGLSICCQSQELARKRKQLKLQMPEEEKAAKIDEPPPIQESSLPGVSISCQCQFEIREDIQMPQEEVSGIPIQNEVDILAKNQSQIVEKKDRVQGVQERQDIPPSVSDEQPLQSQDSGPGDEGESVEEEYLEDDPKIRDDSDMSSDDMADELPPDVT